MNTSTFAASNTINIRAYESGVSCADRSDELLVVATQRNKAVKEGERAKQSVCASIPASMYCKEAIAAAVADGTLVPAITAMLMSSARETLKEAANGGKWEIAPEALSISALIADMESVSADGSRISTASIAAFFNDELSDIIRVQAEIALGYNPSLGTSMVQEEKITFALTHYSKVIALAASKGPIITGRGAGASAKMQFGLQEINSFKHMCNKYFTGEFAAVMQLPVMIYATERFAKFESDISSYMAQQIIALDDAL